MTSSKSARSSQGGLVYSTELGRTCPSCRQALADCRCKAASVPVGDGKVRVSRESKGRGGKTVSLVKGLPLAGDALTALAKQLKTGCGSGGTLRDGVVEIQGDHVERLLTLLQAAGYPAKRSGG
jgi:translation initiation factor 1